FPRLSRGAPRLSTARARRRVAPSPRTARALPHAGHADGADNRLVGGLAGVFVLVMPAADPAG
ncbi:MAG: hypothetical protein Q4G40_10510, partial [Brachybacterium sp.]|nr:hypothetical protein [Brachybacterium sp.]